MLLLFVSIAIAILGFDQLYYTPRSRKISRLKEEVRATELKLDELTLLTKGVGTVESEITRLEKELQGFEGRTLSAEGFNAFLRHLARESNRLQIRIISLISQEERRLPGEEEKKEPSPYKKVNLQMVLHSSFNSLGTYLKEIEELPFFVTINHFRVEREEKVFPLLKVTLGLTVYLLSPVIKERR